MVDVANGMSSESVKKATGKTWDEWIALLDKENLGQKPHKEIAEYIYKKHLSHHKTGWWSQMVTVGYEKTKGLRIDNQNAAGFQISASKTVPVSLDILYSFWEDENKRIKWLNEKFTITKSTKNKSMRIKWVDGKTRVDVGFYAKGEDKSQVAVGHEKIQTQKEAKEKQEFWRKKLSFLQQIIK
jgi:hypothetical protein